MITEDIDPKAQMVSEHLLVLRKHQMVKCHDEDRAMYRLRDRGRKWLNSDLANENLE